jgi:pimeloyl-ACP methyl ester carboxylesterase
MSGSPVLLFSGLTNARLIRHPDDSILTELGIHLITVDRPGMGLSTFQPQRRLVDWPNDVEQLADALHLERFAVVAASAGGPYGLACAYKLPHRLSRIALVSCVAPITLPHLFAAVARPIRMQIVLANRAPVVLAGLYRVMRVMLRRNPDRMLQQLVNQLPESDQAIARTPGLLPLLAQDIQEALRQGGYGSAVDLRVISRPWGFDLGSIQVGIMIWQGDTDANVPPIMAQYLASTIPNCRATFVSGAGHFLIYSHWRDILTQVVGPQSV